MCKIIFRKYYERFTLYKETTVSFEDNLRKLMNTIEQGEKVIFETLKQKK